MKRFVLLALSLAAVLLGGLWLLQGLGLVQVKPILCFADCEPLQGPSAAWAVIGFLVLAAGAFGIARQLRNRRHS